MGVMTLPSTWRVEFYQDARGHRPVETWLSALDNKTQARIRRTLRLLEDYGTQLGMPHSRHLRGKVWELRTAVGKQDYRILYFAVVGHKFILLHSFSKKTMETPAGELEIAEGRMLDYQTRSEKGS